MRARTDADNSLSVLKSSVSTNTETFKQNAAAHEAALAKVAEAAALAAAGGGERSRERHLSRGKMLPRDRVANLLDAGSPFIEIGATAAHEPKFNSYA